MQPALSRTQAQEYNTVLRLINSFESNDVQECKEMVSALKSIEQPALDCGLSESLLVRAKAIRTYLNLPTNNQGTIALKKDLQRRITQKISSLENTIEARSNGIFARMARFLNPRQQESEMHRAAPPADMPPLSLPPAALGLTDGPSPSVRARQHTLSTRTPLGHRESSSEHAYDQQRPAQHIPRQPSRDLEELLSYAFDPLQLLASVSENPAGFDRVEILKSIPEDIIKKSNDLSVYIGVIRNYYSQRLMKQSLILTFKEMGDEIKADIRANNLSSTQIRVLISEYPLIEHLILPTNTNQQA